MKGGLEVADILRQYGLAYRETHKLPVRHHRVMRAIEICRTAELGRKVASGIYIYRLKASTFIQTRKMLLVQ